MSTATLKSSLQGNIIFDALQAFYKALRGLNRSWIEQPKDKHGHFDMDGVSFEAEEGVIVASSHKSACGKHIDEQQLC